MIGIVRETELDDRESAALDSFIAVCAAF